MTLGMESTTVLVIDEDREFVIGCGQSVRDGGYEVVLANDPVRGLSAIRSTNPEVVVLDPRTASFEAVKVIALARELTEGPLIVYSPASEMNTRIEYLSAGADVVLPKSQGNGELLAQIAAFRRWNSAANQDSADCFDDGLVQVDFRARLVKVNGEQVELTPTEYRLLVALIRNLGGVLSNTELLAAAWNDSSGVAPERVKFGVMRLRRKLGDGAIRVEAVRGFGYRYERRTRSADRRASRQRSATRRSTQVG